ncbi:hypothetical protein ASG22_06050 [Chryseobacterium sp. Leaf405]|uniref:hypothetical protein n=1 Tax=Chryseobacterium sp. Leaf405 TaxID=1736367 RepID=UPI000701AFA1|nr:hypothetical protein [Chryseobacterium sp. Leaf405]KQT26230.1 hypothetical protein ASG22_06050 [Chryseobacterium sp. Leaf405]
MGKHSTEISLKLFDFLIDLGKGLRYYTDTEYPMKENSFGSQAIDIAWFNNQENKFPLFIFEIESSSNNSIANNPTKIFGKDSKVFEKPLFFFHIIIDGAENSEKYNDLIGLFGKHNYDIFRINNADIENLLVKIISQHRRIHNEANLAHILRLINNFEEIKSEIKFELFLKNIEKLIHENQLYELGQIYADVASSDKSFQEQYLKFIYRFFSDERSFYLSYENYSASIVSEFINLGLLYSRYGNEINDFDFTKLLIEAQKTETFNKIEYLPGLNYEYDIFIQDHVAFYIALTFFLFEGNVSAQKYIIDIAIMIIRKLNITEGFIFEHNLSWGLLMAASNHEFSEIYEELKNLMNNRKGILNTILFCPTFINEHQKIPDSKLILVPDRNIYVETFKEKFNHINIDNSINEIAIMSLSEDWKDEMEYYFNLGIDLANLAIKSLMKKEW